VSEFAKTVRSLRATHGDDLADCAELAGISEDHLRHIEKGRSPSIAVVGRLCTALELTTIERRGLLLLWLRERGVEW
jgi:transcriptional regulator with XRE-family HTH domain